MKKTAFFLAILCFLMCFSLPVSAEEIPSVSAKSAVLIDGKSGEILFGKGENTRRGMASTTKIMTALVALEAVSPDMIVRVAPEACGIEGSSVYLYPEEEIRMETLLYALMLQSANDAAAAIAYAVAGGIPEFAALMNAKAEALGLTDTHFENPHGLDGKTHYTTALELARITMTALENEVFREIVGTEKKAIPLHNGEATRLLVNHNRLLRDFDDIIGVKTGYTRACGRTLVSAAERDGVLLICVTLDDGNDWRDHRALLDYGFSLYEEKTLLSEGALSLALPVCGGVSDAVMLTNASEIKAFLPKGHGEMRVVFELPRFVYGGILRGEKVGYVKLFAGEHCVGESVLIASEDVPEQKKPTLFEKIRSFFGIGAS